MEKDKPQESQPEASVVNPRPAGSVSQTHFFQGPMPPPEMLGGYDRVFPGCAERIVAMTEGQASHRQKMESRMLWFDGIQAFHGHFLGFGIVLAGFGVGAWLIMNDKDGAGLLTAGAPLASTLFAWFKQKDNKSTSSDDDKRQK